MSRVSVVSSPYLFRPRPGEPNLALASRTASGDNSGFLSFLNLFRRQPRIVSCEYKNAQLQELYIM